MDDLNRKSKVLCNCPPLLSMLAALFVDLREPTPTTRRVGWNLLKIQGMYGATEVADLEASTKWVSSFFRSVDGGEGRGSVVDVEGKKYIFKLQGRLAVVRRLLNLNKERGFCGMDYTTVGTYYLYTSL